MKLKRTLITQAVALVLFGYAGVVSAAPTAEELQKQIDHLNTVVNNGADGNDGGRWVTKDELDGLRAALEDFKYDNQRNRDTKTALTKRGTTLSGTVQTRASYVTSPTTSGAASNQSTPRDTSFDIPLANVAFTGSLYKDYSEGRNFDYKVGFGYARSSATTTTTSAAATSTFNLQDAYLQYTFSNTVVTGLEEPALNVRFGQQQTAFGLEAQTTDELKPSINSAQFVSGLGVGTRQIGIILRGDLEPYVDYGFNYRAPLIEYALGVVNGAGPNQSDNNSRKDYLGRIAFTAPVDYTSWLRELKFGLSYQHGVKNILTKVTNSSGVVTTPARDGNYDRYGFDLYYNHLPVGVTYEYVYGRDEALVTDGALPPSASNLATTDTGVIRNVLARGQTLTFFITWGEQWLKSSNGNGQGKFDDWWPKTFQPFVRFDRWDPNTANKAASGTNVSGQSDITTYGFNFFFAETTKFQVNVNNYKFKNPAKKSYHELLLQYQFGF